MQDAPERIWAIPDDNEDGCCPLETDLNDTGRFFDTERAVAYTRTDLCITEAECQRRIDAAVLAEREACAWTAQSFLVGDPKNGIPLRSPMASEIAAAIRARGQK